MYIFTGYRSVPLKNEYSEPLELAALLVWVDMRNPKVIYYLYPKIYKPWHGVSNNVVYATSKASDQPVHTRSLIRAYSSCFNIL